MPFFFSRRACLVAALATSVRVLADTTAGPVRLPAVEVTAAPSLADRHRLPQATETVTAPQLQATVNVVDTEDAVKYLPSIFLRKRNYGDTQPVMATRVWGVSSSARSLVYGDGILLTALIANNNSLGAPRWGIIAPAEIERVDVMYGPFAAAYPGNSMGAVLEITTRQPEQFEAAFTQTMAWQGFDLYDTHHVFRTTQSALSVGQRAGPLSFWLSGNFQDSHSQPLSYVTVPAFPAATTGGFSARNKLGDPAHVVGATGLLHTRMANAKAKVAYEVTPWLRAAYTFGVWRNDGDAAVETYLRNAAGEPTFAGLAGFASGYSELGQQHTAHSFTLKSDPTRAWDFGATASLYRMDRDWQRLPATAAANGTSFSRAGRVALLSGTAWSNLDVNGGWRSAPHDAAHAVTFGVHADRYTLRNPTYNTSDWRAGSPATSVATQGDGTTRTRALWAEETWRLVPAVKLTLGARYEEWRAYEGLNVNGATVVRQPAVRDRGLSPKASAAWAVSPQWLLTASLARAYRFATPAELYQLVSTGPTFTSPSPNLKPDNVVAAEVRLERRFDAGRLRVSLFEDNVHDAIISQFNPLVPGSAQVYSFLSNVDHVRARGVELVVERSHLGLPGLSASGSATYLDARTLALSGRASATAPAGAAQGRRLPNIPDWRATFVLTYRPDERWSFTAAGRYSGMMFTTLDNADVNPNTWQGFAAWFVADARVQCRLDAHWSASLGADNLLNRKYFLFHPFPQRTWVVDVKLAF